MLWFMSCQSGLILHEQMWHFNARNTKEITAQYRDEHNPWDLDIRYSLTFILLRHRGGPSSYMHVYCQLVYCRQWSWGPPHFPSQAVILHQSHMKYNNPWWCLFSQWRVTGNYITHLSYIVLGLLCPIRHVEYYICIQEQIYVCKGIYTFWAFYL